MTSIIRIKRSSVSGNPAVLGVGELAYSALPDNGSNGGDRLYIGMGTEIGGNAANHVVIGGKFVADAITNATALATPGTIVRRDSSGNIAVGTITGNVVGNVDTASRWLQSRDLSLTGDATATLLAVDGTANVSAALTLKTVNTNTGTWGSSTEIPVFTVNGKGLITGVSTASVATTLTISDGSVSDTVNLISDTLTFVGGTGVTSTVTNNQVSFAIGQAVNTTSNVTFNDVSVNGTLYSNDITAASVTVGGNAIITGNLTVQGTTTTINSTAVAIADINLSLAKDAVNATQANGAGLTVVGPTIPATLLYSSVNDSWNFNKDLYVTNIHAALIGNADTATKWATARNLSLTGDATATLASVDGTADVSTAITFKTVNTNTGSFGSGVSVPNFTVNGKGLITAAGETAIPTATSSVLGLAAFDSNNFSVTAGLVSIAGVDGGIY